MLNHKKYRGRKLILRGVAQWVIKNKQVNQWLQKQVKS